MSTNPRIQALEGQVEKYEQSIVVFRTINEKLRTLPLSDRVQKLIELNENILVSTERVLASTRIRLDHARLNVTGRGSASPFATSVTETKHKRAADETSGAT